ncbi:hypothetical protein SPSYN_01393 [Sporotomaculum syntrophicum]|uniref:HTH arsR-type domain-containing protein n=1 Tax=Sporotomaculum syntrophicum TaxID=182264 RepID=A0A9D3AXP5_9FIRM|nr:metalloregulator ArsR/SmtB family transcription factor [Sporotomaculum syntrophicum]KAF1085257.1 hypothetical protein SPSYN_01393 [Sporotomaculum syntrophicum]
MDQVDINSVEQIARLFKILSDPNRLRIISVLGKNECSVSELINGTGLPQTLVSFHLKTLRDSGMVDTERKGPFIYYRLKSPVLIDLLGAFNQYTFNGQKNKDMATGMPCPCSPWFFKKS